MPRQELLQARHPHHLLLQPHHLLLLPHPISHHHHLDSQHWNRFLELYRLYRRHQILHRLYPYLFLLDLPSLFPRLDPLLESGNFIKL